MEKNSSQPHAGYGPVAIEEKKFWRVLMRLASVLFDLYLEALVV